MRTSIGIFDLLLIAITLWAVTTWTKSLIKDIKKYATRGELLAETKGGMNYYHFLGIAYLLVLIVIKGDIQSPFVRNLVIAGFMVVSGISVYRALRRQGLFENGLCIPEQNADLTAIKFYKWGQGVEVEGYIPLYLKVMYSNMLTKYGGKIIKLYVPIEQRATVQKLLKGIEGCKEAQ